MEKRLHRLGLSKTGLASVTPNQSSALDSAAGSEDNACTVRTLRDPSLRSNTIACIKAFLHMMMMMPKSLGIAQAHQDTDSHCCCWPAGGPWRVRRSALPCPTLRQPALALVSTT